MISKPDGVQDKQNYLGQLLHTNEVGTLHYHLHLHYECRGFSFPFQLWFSIFLNSENEK